MCPCTCRQRAAATDRKGFFGCVCDHMILHLAVMLVTGENWRAAVLLIQRLLECGVCPAVILYDINCRWSAYWRKWLAAQATLSAEAVKAAAQTMLPLPPFHANMHNETCREGFSIRNPRYAAWCNPAGETTEQYWAYMGALTRLKYATKHYGKLYLESLCSYLNQRHGEELASFLLKRVQKLDDLAGITTAQIRFMEEEDGDASAQV